jgi:hypothetical protein
MPESGEENDSEAQIKSQKAKVKRHKSEAARLRWAMVTGRLLPTNFGMPESG